MYVNLDFSNNSSIYLRQCIGKNCKVIGVGMHTESEEKLVLYQSQYGNFDLWARPVSLWL